MAANICSPTFRVRLADSRVFVATTDPAIGSNAPSAEGQTSHVLFDPMTHTPKGCVFSLNIVTIPVLINSSNSGIGDLGIVGLQDFISSHICNDLCKTLGLASLVILEAQLLEFNEAAQPDSQE